MLDTDNIYVIYVYVMVLCNSDIIVPLSLIFKDIGAKGVIIIITYRLWLAVLLCYCTGEATFLCSGSH